MVRRVPDRRAPDRRAPDRRASSTAAVVRPAPDKRASTTAATVTTATATAASSDVASWEALERAKVTATPETVVIRSLRRRLWKAFSRQDGRAAYKIYQATREDWETWRFYEIQTAALRMARRKQQRSLFRRKSAPLEALQQTLQQQQQASPATPNSTRKQVKNIKGFLEQHMNPSEAFVADDYKDPLTDPYDDDDDHETTKNGRRKPPPRRASRRASTGPAPRKPNGPRLAFWLPKKNNDAAAGAQEEAPIPSQIVARLAKMDPHLTTPLHEAARLAHVKLVKLMLLQDVNARNGMGRTALHMVAGGVVPGEVVVVTGDSDAGPPPEQQPSSNSSNNKTESSNTVAAALVGIRGPQPIVLETDQEAQAKEKRFRLFGGGGNSQKRQQQQQQQEAEAPPKLSRAKQDELRQARVEIVEMILAWTPPDATSDQASEGPSINAVDANGRTALHYAAELGRDDVCQTVASAFGAMLTVVDDQGRTPCELASQGGHKALASQLEARALLYVDPYGIDEDLLHALQNQSLAQQKLVAPFSWFDTWDRHQVHMEREKRIEVAFLKMQAIVEKRNASRRKRLEILKSTNGNTSSPTQQSAGETELESLEALHTTHVEMYLQYHKWDVKAAIQAFFEAPVEDFYKAQIPFPRIPQKRKRRKSSSTANVSRVCLICCDVFDPHSKDSSGSAEWKDLQGCDHSFCNDCLGDYLTDCAQSKSSGLVIPCPHHDCNVPLAPLEIAALAPSADVYEQLLAAASEAFVVSARDLRFCPHPGCTGICKFKIPAQIKQIGLDPAMLETAGAVCTAVHPRIPGMPVTYEGVSDPHYTDCTSEVPPNRAHRFCFACGEVGSHWPISCERVSEWKDEVAKYVNEVNQEEGGGNTSGGSGGTFEEVAQKLWMKANTRPCPKCKAPIEKNEGCNHMTCSNPWCKHEFCWICRNDWKLHNTETGGFFRCNRWVDQKEHDYYDEKPEDVEAIANPRNEDLSNPHTMQATYGTAMHETRVAARRAREMNRFLFHYRRWSAHEESAALETRMGQSVCQRLAPVVHAAIEFSCAPDFNFRGKGLSFVHAAFVELTECRSILQHSFAFSYFRYKSTNARKYKLLKKRLAEKLNFEQFQAELEMMTEQISDVVARAHLRATQSQITFLTAAAADKRKEFSNYMITILVDDLREQVRAANKKAAAEKKQREGSGSDRSTGSHESDQKPPAVIATDESPSRSTGAPPPPTFVLAMEVPTGFTDEEAATPPATDGLGTSQHSDTSVEDTSNQEAPAATLRTSSAEFRAEMDNAVQASLQEFMRDAAHDAAQVARGETKTLGEWTCTACTYMNGGGGRCAMCGTRKAPA